MKFKGVLLGVGYSDEDLTAYIKNLKTGHVDALKETRFRPYLIFTGKKEPRHELIVKAKKTKHGYKVFVEKPSDVPKLRQALGKGCREFDVPFAHRFLVDNSLFPMKVYEWDWDEKGLVKAKEAKDDYKLKTAALDIETYNARGMSDAKKDPVLMLSVYNGKKGAVFTWKKGKKKFVKTLENEAEAIKNALEYCDADVIYTYNGDNFDLPYIKTRCTILKQDAPWNIRLHQGMRGTKARIAGKVHVDAYRCMRFLAAIGALRLPRYTLEDVYTEVTGKKKIDIAISGLWKKWDDGDLEEVFQYSLEDAEAAFELGEYSLPLHKELACLIGQTVFDVSRMTASQIVESLLFRMSYERGSLAPNKPGPGQVRVRSTRPIKGAFVKTPESGLHENIAILDFRGLYPSIIISHNIDPSTIECECCKKPFVSPNGHKFCKKKKGLIPTMLRQVVGTRARVKAEMKKHPKNPELRARQHALKIVANATYGYMNYARARWFSRECAEAVTAWGRDYIQNAISQAERFGFKVLYGDTDSLFLLRGRQSKKQVVDFVKKYNKGLPKEMELELEGFFTRGIFVTKREGGAAKKRYALLREDGAVEIKGLEFVRRDWSKIAKRTQEQVIRAVLEGRIEEAKELVVTVISDVRKGKVALDDLAIFTQLKRRIDKYVAVGPHVKAAQRLVQAGEDVGAGSMITYVVARGAGNIGDKAYPISMMKNRKPDPEYYIEHQILPAVMKILRELGIEEEELKTGSKQSGLEKWA